MGLGTQKGGPGPSGAAFSSLLASMFNVSRYAEPCSIQDPVSKRRRNKNKQTKKQTNEQTTERTTERANEQTNKQTTKRTNEHTNEQTNKRTN